MDGGAWWAAVHGITKGQTRLRDFTFNFHFHALEEEMATHSSVLAWRTPGTREPGGIQELLWWLSGKRIHLPMQETQEIWVRSLDWEDLLEKELASHSSILTWEIPGIEESGRL